MLPVLINAFFRGPLSMCTKLSSRRCWLSQSATNMLPWESTATSLDMILYWTTSWLLHPWDNYFVYPVNLFATGDGHMLCEDSDGKLFNHHCVQWQHMLDWREVKTPSVTSHNSLIISRCNEEKEQRMATEQENVARSLASARWEALWLHLVMIYLLPYFYHF